MLDLFAIFSKSGIVLFATVNSSLNGFSTYLNRVIRNVILEDRVDKFQIDTLLLQFCLDNEFELVFVVGYQKMLTLSYVDKFLTDIQLAFRDKFKDFDLRNLLQAYSAQNCTPVNSKFLTENDRKASFHDGLAFDQSIQPINFNLVNFMDDFKFIYSACNRIHQQTGGKPKVAEMRSFEQSQKSKKTVASMIIQPKSDTTSKPKPDVKPVAPNGISVDKVLGKDEILKKFASKNVKSSPKVKKTKTDPKKKTKKPTVWEFGGKCDTNLDFSKKVEGDDGQMSSSVAKNIINSDLGSKDVDMQPDLEFESSEEEDDYEEIEQRPTKNEKQGFFGSIVSSFSYNKTLTKADLDPILTNLRDHLIAKNVAVEIAGNLCDSVAIKLEGQSVNTWLGLKGFVKNALEESILRILSPNRNINILREVQVKNDAGNPYVIVFCGVNGVGKSTNLAKIANWLLVNGIRVLVIACDTFRAGAIEQLRTHIHALKNIYETDDGYVKIELFEKGYGKDSTAIAMEGIRYAHNMGFNCCLVDTAGRMQGNEPLMKQLAKLIKVNEPDLTLFVGEALVGNEAVDQLVNFNKALLDNGCRSATNSSVSAINGIVLTKFDTIDDQVGAAISMTYITGQPIVFVGVGQTYRDLKQLNAKAVVRALMK